MSFTHSHVGDLAAALVDDQLDQDTRDLVLLHLGRCAGCRADVEEQRQLKARLSALSEPGLPGGLLARLGALSGPAQPPGSGPLGSSPPQAAKSPDELTKEALASVTPIGTAAQLGSMRRGRRMLAGAASLLLVGAGTAIATGGGTQPVSPLSPATSFQTSFSVPTPVRNAMPWAPTATLPLTDPAFPATTAAFSR